MLKSGKKRSEGIADEDKARANKFDSIMQDAENLLSLYERGLGKNKSPSFHKGKDSNQTPSRQSPSTAKKRSSTNLKDNFPPQKNVMSDSPYT